jgi:hypothetical protein
VVLRLVSFDTVKPYRLTYGSYPIVALMDVENGALSMAGFGSVTPALQSLTSPPPARNQWSTL